MRSHNLSEIKINMKTHSDHEFGGLELPESDIDGDTTLTLSLQLVEHPSCTKDSLTSASEDHADFPTHHT